MTFDKFKRRNILLICDSRNYRTNLHGDTIEMYVSEREFKDILDKVGLPYIKKGEW